MVICFNSTPEAKKALDFLLESRQFKDVSEAISMALVNYEVIHNAVSTGNSVQLPERPTSRSTGGVITSSPGTSRDAISTKPGTSRISDLFSRGETELETLNFLPASNVNQRTATDLPPAEWLFGQYNKLLPVKATCRAMLNLLRNKPAGIPVDEAASTISHAACSLGDYLLAFDDRHQLRRDEAFASAFPSTAIDGSGSRLRFGNQFVANMKQNQLEGLPADLRFIAVDSAREPRLSLTKAGAEFAVLENPVLDGGADSSKHKFSGAETQFLLAHIAASVPEETSAYLAVINAIENKADSPEQMDVWLRKQFGLPKESDIAKTFLSTQRTGAISRMADLGLIARQKKGLHVTYLATETGTTFRKSILKLI